MSKLSGPHESNPFQPNVVFLGVCPDRLGFFHFKVHPWEELAEVTLLGGLGGVVGVRTCMLSRMVLA